MDRLGITQKNQPELEQSKMHYVQYLPGTIAHITEHPTRHGCEDVNRLSRLVAKFNTWLVTGGYSCTASIKIGEFVQRFKEFQL